MSDSFAVSSLPPASPSSISDRGAQQDVSTDQGPLQSLQHTDLAESVFLEKNIPAALQGSYHTSTAQLEAPQFQLSHQDLAELSELSQQDFSARGTAAANSTAASSELSIIEVYLKNQQNIERNFTNPGAPHAALTAQYQQQMIESTLGNPLPFVAVTALNVQKNTSEAEVSADSTSSKQNSTAPVKELRGHERREGRRTSRDVLLNQISTSFNGIIALKDIGRNNDVLSHHSNAVGSHGNVVGRDSKHNVARDLAKKEAIVDSHKTPTSSGPVSTATYTNRESLDDLRRNLSAISTENILAGIQAQDVRSAEAREQDTAKLLTKHDLSVGSNHESHAGLSSDDPFVDGKIAGLAANAVDTNSAIAAEYGGQQAASVNESNFAAALQLGLKTLSEVTSPLRSQPLKVG